MDKEFIEERIKELQSDNKLYFKQTSEIIEFAYRTAINDCGKPITKNNKLANKEKEQQSIIENQTKIIEDLKRQLKEYESKSKKPSSKNNSNKKDIINAKLEVYNKIYDMIYFKKLDLLAIYQNIKGEIDILNEKLKIS